jgi:hypothetical protein
MPGMLRDEFPYNSQASSNTESKLPWRVSAQVLEDESCSACVAEALDSENSSCLPPLGCNSSELLASELEERSWLKEPLRVSDFDRRSEAGDLLLEDLTIIH